MSGGGYTRRPQQAFFSRIRIFTDNYYDAESDGRALNQHVSVGTGMDGRWNSFFRVELNRDNVRVRDEWLARFRPRFLLEASPGRVLNQCSISVYLGDEIDFANARKGNGASWQASVSLRPGDHLELRGNASLRNLDVAAAAGGSKRLFTAQVERLRATWSFSSRSFVRLIGQYVRTERDASLYGAPVPAREADLRLSGLFAYKLNWQTVLYAGYGDSRTFAEASDRLEPNGRQAFAKVSYAWQR